MISTEKRYGQYVLKPATEIFASYLGDDAGDNQRYVSSCAISSRWTSLVLVSKRQYNHDTSIFRFALPAGVSRLNLPVGSHLLIKAPGAEHDGGDAIRPYTSVSDDALPENSGQFEILVKRYAQWGVKEGTSTHFLFTRTDHTYRKAGAVSNFIHRLALGTSLEFKHTDICIGRFPYPLTPHVRSLTLIAVGVGIAPMIGILRALLQETNAQVVLLYGVREVADLLMRETLEAWARNYAPSGRFRVVFCVGSRFDNVHMGARTRDEYIPPPPPVGYDSLCLEPSSQGPTTLAVASGGSIIGGSYGAEKAAAQLIPGVDKALGWVNEDKIRAYAFAPAASTRVVVCGLPGVYDKICGSRFETDVPPGCALHSLGYMPDMTIKL